MVNPLRIWLLSPYHTGSHKAWAEGYAQHSQHQIGLLSMAGRFWKWRMQGGAVELAAQARQRLESGECPDAILTTDMVNLPVWLGLLRHKLPTHIPILHYMHENQLTYPWRPGEKPDLTYAMINWLSQLSADCIAFNSHYHMDSWFDELPRLLKHFPDYNHLDQIEAVRKRSLVLPVGIQLAQVEQLSSQYPVENLPILGKSGDNSGDNPLILWNQRWEYDKRPDIFFDILYRLYQADVPFRLAVAGENFRRVPEEFEQAQERLQEQIVHWGYAQSYTDYLALLLQSDLVISTAIHEFFGISILEAIAAGVFPLLPNRLSYPELIPKELHPACLYRDEEELYTKAMHRLQQPRAAPPSLRRHVADTFDWRQVAPRYDRLLAELQIQ